MSSNWMELGLSTADEEFVRRNAELYRKVYVETIDTIFDWAKAIEILRRHHKKSGIQGGFAAALVQFGFTARDGGPMNKAIVSHFKGLHDNEQAVRAWWASVPDKKKRDWLSAKAIYSHWQASLIPKATPKTPEPITPAAPTKAPLTERPQTSADVAKLQAEIAALKAENARLKETGVIDATQFEQIVNAKVRERIDAADNACREQNKEMRAEILSYQRIVDQKGIYSTRQWRLMVSLCHVDTNVSDEVRTELLQILMDKDIKKELINPALDPKPAKVKRPIDFAKIEEVVKRYAQGKTGVGFGPILDRVEAAVPETNWRAQNNDREIMHAVHNAVYGYLYQLGFKPTSASNNRWTKQ